MTRWTQLRAEINAARGARRVGAIQNAMVGALKRAVQQQICAREAPHWIQRDGREVGLIDYGDATIGRHRAIALSNLPALENARLTFRVVLDREDNIVEYTVGAVGNERSSGRDWYVRIDLDPEQRGRGPCHHPLLHCHVGVDADESSPQAMRAPLPWLYPDEALTWILATVHDQLEPPAS